MDLFWTYFLAWTCVLQMSKNVTKMLTFGQLFPGKNLTIKCPNGTQTLGT